MQRWLKGEPDWSLLIASSERQSRVNKNLRDIVTAGENREKKWNKVVIFRGPLGGGVEEKLSLHSLDELVQKREVKVLFGKHPLDMINFTQSFDTNILIASHDEVGEIFASVLAERSD